MNELAPMTQKPWNSRKDASPVAPGRLTCVVRTPGRRTLYGHKGGSSTARPLLDQVRQVRDYICGMGSYGPVVSKHIAGCRKCHPNDLLDAFERVTPPSTMRPDAALRVLFRTDRRMDRGRAIKLIATYGGPKIIPWMARNATREQLWSGMVAIDKAQRECGSRAKWVVFAGPKKWQPGDDVGLKIVGIETRVPPALRKLVATAAAVHNSGGAVPATYAEARRLVPSLEVHGS